MEKKLDVRSTYTFFNPFPLHFLYVRNFLSFIHSIVAYIIFWKIEIEIAFGVDVIVFHCMINYVSNFKFRMYLRFFFK